MAYTSADLDAIDRALATGELEVRIDDKLIKYQSADDILTRRRAIVGFLAAQSNPNRSTPRYTLANFNDD